MKRAYIALSTFVLILVLLVVYRGWLGLAPLSAGDWSFHFSEEVAHFFMFPSSWRVAFGGGLGGNGVFLAGLETYFLATARILYQLTGLPWAVSERILWYIPFLLVGAGSSIYLVRTVFPNLMLWWLTPIIFLTNTYILMITGGGQMGIAMAYAVAPLVLAQFIKLFDHPTTRRGIITGLILSLMVLFDPRITYVLMIGVLLWWLVSRSKPTFVFALPFLCTVFIHAFWILPLLVFRVNPIESLGGAYNSVASVKFFSFADFSHALSLLHPNWPENLFGKVYFLQPEFLVIPILAFSSLFFIKQKSDNRKLITFFALLALLGVFLSKGANPPAGGIYLWLFAHVPGFNVFRDPTKLYLLTAIAYSILIPAALERIGKKVLVIVFVLFWLFTIRQSVTGQLGGTFASHTVPSEYEVLKSVINQPDYFRTFWVPHVGRYGFSTYTHPSIDAGSVLNTSSPSAMLTWIDSDEGKHQLARWSVRYVVLPYDSQGEIFLDDRKYSEKERNVFQKALDSSPDLIKKIIPGITTKMSVYEMMDYNDHLWVEDQNVKLTWRMISPTSYAVSISGLDRPARLIFSESFDPYWQLDIGDSTIRSQKTEDSLNSFSLPALATASGTLEYLPQRYVWSGMVISALTIIGIIVVFIVL
jgi:hypothetical protein